MRTIRPRLGVALVASAFGAALVAGCASTDVSGAEGNPEARTQITIAEQSRGGLTAGALPHLADELGYFEEEGLEVEDYVVVTKSADAISGVLSGEVHFAHIGGEGFMAASQGGDIVGIAANTDTSIWTILGHSEIDDWDDLKGTTIALGSTGDITRVVFDQLARQAGLNPDRDLNYVALGATPQRITAVQQGQAAATLAAYAGAGRAIEEGLTDLDFAPEGTEPPQLMTTEISASRSWAEEHPDETAGYLRAIAKARDFLQDSDNADRAAELITQVSGEPVENIKQGLEVYFSDPPLPEAAFPADFRHVPGAFDATVEAYRELGIFRSEINEEEYMDYSYADRATGK